MDNQINILREKRDSYQTSKNIYASFKYAFNGLIYCFKTTRNFRIQILFGILIIIICLAFNCNLTEYIIDVLTTSVESFSLKYLNKDASMPLEYNVFKKANKVYIIKIIPVSLGVNKFV